MTSTQRGVGRPRDTEIDEAILNAARELLAEVGYAQVTMDATAARAGSSKAAIYRRYQSKAELLFAAAMHGNVANPPADTGSLQGDLLALGERIRATMSSSAAREVAPQVIAEIGRSAELSRRLREAFVAVELEEISAILERAVDRGELLRKPEVLATHRLLGGALFFSTYVVDEPLSDANLADVVHILSTGLTGTMSVSGAPTAPGESEHDGTDVPKDL